MIYYIIQRRRSMVRWHFIFSAFLLLCHASLALSDNSMGDIRKRASSGGSKTGKRMPSKRMPGVRLGNGTKSSHGGKKGGGGDKMQHLPMHLLQPECFQPVIASESIPAFWVNLDRSVHRRRFFTEQMQQMGMKHKRIRALTADEVTGNMTTLHVSPAIKQTPHELACVASHLVAIHSAVHDETIDPTNPYALIVEDDVSFEMDVDFKSLANSAPKDFGILQLMTSNSHEVGNLWGKYLKKDKPLDMWTRRSWNSGYWSTQGYLVNKANVKGFIDKVVTRRSDGSYKLDIINPAPSQFPCRGGGGGGGGGGKCTLPFRIVADIYIFTGCGPTYMANIPVFNGANVGQNSTIHYRKNNDVSHAKSFLDIATVLNRVRNATSLIPPFIRKKSCVGSTSISTKNKNNNTRKRRMKKL